MITLEAKDIDYEEAFSFRCPKCGKALTEWNLNPDPGALRYNTECCDTAYWMTPTKVNIESEPV